MVTIGRMNWRCSDFVWKHLRRKYNFPASLWSKRSSSQCRRRGGKPFDKKKEEKKKRKKRRKKENKKIVNLTQLFQKFLFYLLLSFYLFLKFCYLFSYFLLYNESFCQALPHILAFFTSVEQERTGEPPDHQSFQKLLRGYIK